jgi:hypothetical protein
LAKDKNSSLESLEPEPHRECRQDNGRFSLSEMMWSVLREEYKMAVSHVKLPRRLPLLAKNTCEKQARPLEGRPESLVTNLLANSPRGAASVVGQRKEAHASSLLSRRRPHAPHPWHPQATGSASLGIRRLRLSRRRAYAPYPWWSRCCRHCDVGFTFGNHLQASSLSLRGSRLLLEYLYY